MDNSNIVRIKTEVEDKNGRIATALEENSIVKTEFESARTEDNNILADMIAKKVEFVSDNEKKYSYIRILSSEGGEGVVAVCNNETFGDVAVKVYIDVKNVDLEKRQRVIKFTNTDNAEKYVLPIIDSGFIELESGTKNYFEVQPLCVEGDLLHKGKYTYDELVKIIEELNEGLHFIHENGFLHMDIKPENIYSFNNRYVFGDFGITRELDTEGQSVTRMTHVGKRVSGTEGYQAPEVLYGSKRKFTSKTDYYSLAVTLASLYVGEFVFLTNGKYDAEKFEDSAETSHIDLGNNSDKRTLLLQNLIDGLFQRDRRYRFGYEDVCKWLQDQMYKGALENLSVNKISWSSPFQGSSKTDLLYTEKELFNWIIHNWEDAKKRLYRGDIERHFFMNSKSFVTEEIVNIREIKYPNIGTDGDKAIFETCLLIYSETDTPLVWKGAIWNSLQIFADEILSSKDSEFYAEMFEKELVSMWLEKTGLLANDDKQMELIRDIENKSKCNSRVACFWFAYVFASKQEIEFQNNSFSSVIELIDKLMSSPVLFYAEGGYLDWLLNLNESYRFFGFMCSGGIEQVGCAEYVYTYLSEKVSDLCKRVHLLFVLFEQVGIALNQSKAVENIRGTYLKYGPYGDISYIHNLVKNTDYFCSDMKEGISILNEIRKREEVQLGTISTMGKDLIELKKLTDSMYEKMQNNPLLAQAGIYNNKIIKCRNLQGYNLYRYLNRDVPLGYKKLVE